MNPLFPWLLAALVQATVLLLAATILCRLTAARRSVLVTTLILLFALPLVNAVDFMPRFRLPTAETEMTESRSSAVGPSAAESTAPTHGGIDLRKLADWLGQVRQSLDHTSPDFRAWFAGIFLIGVGFSVAGGLRSWRWLSWFRARLRPVDEPLLREELDVLAREVGIHRRIKLFECDEPNLVATFGLFRPAVVLPPEWVSWSEAERKAALAHELAHVARFDFAIGVLARLVACLYWCHPLVYRLRRELNWRQEIDADALAADLIGGRPIYRKSLARLALRLPTEGRAESPLPLPALTGSSLLRRFDMLRKTESTRPASSRVKLGVALLLCGLTLALSTLRGWADAKTETKPNELPPFELGYLTPSSKGILAVRPSEFFAQPGMDGFAKRIDALTRQAMKILSVELPASLKLENIEQIVTNCELTTQMTGKPGSRSISLGTGSVLIRMKEKFDWVGFAKSLPIKLETHDCDGIKVHEIKLPKEILPVPSGIYAPDERTVVLVSFDTVEHLKERIASFKESVKKEPKPIWKALNGSALAMTIDNTGGEYTKRFDKDLESDPESRKFLASVEAFAFGVELGDDRPIRFLFDAAKDVDPKSLREQFDGFIAKARDQAKAEAEKENDIGQMQRKAMLEITDSPKVKIDGRRLDWQGFSKLRAKDFAEQIEKELPGGR